MKLRYVLALAALGFTASAFAAGVKGDAAAGKILAEQGRDAAKGKPAVTACASCHGKAGAAPISAENPLLAGQHPDYLVHALKAYKDGSRKHNLMNTQAAALSDKDINDLSVYYSQQKSTVHEIGTGKITK